ncbi:MAG: RloB family protein [Sphaerochaetaceae bacterium]|jgi:hypothetical protein
MKRRKKVIEKPRKTFLIVAASEAESLYFSQMRKDCRYTNMTVLWAEEIETLEDLIKFAAKERTKGKFDRTWAVFSFEQMGVDEADVKEMQVLANKRKIQLAWTNPDLPLWYLMHLQVPTQVISEGKAIENTLRGVFKEFDSSAEYLLDEGSSLHLKLFPAKAQAVMNSGSYNNLALAKGATLVPMNFTKLTTEIADYCGVADMSHNQKMIGLKNN